MIPTTLGSLAAVAFGLGLYFKWQKEYPKITCYLMLLAGIGVSGALGALLATTVRAAFAGANALTATLLGAGVGAVVLFVWIASLWVHLFRPRSTPTKVTAWIALLTPPLLLIVGGAALLAVIESGAGALSQIASDLFNDIIDAL